MDAILKPDPGLMIWTIINFLFFLILIVKFGTKPLKAFLKARESSIQSNIDHAEKLNAEAREILKSAQEKIDNAENEVSKILTLGKSQAENFMKKAAEEADHVKRQKVEEAIREIDRSKENTIKELRKEVASLAVSAVEKILGEEMNKEKHYKMIEQNIDNLPKN